MQAPTQDAASDHRAFIYYWRRYWRVNDERRLPLYNLSQNSRTMTRMHDKDIVWAFTRRKHAGAYVFVARFVVLRAGENDEADRSFGRWFFTSEEPSTREAQCPRQPP